LNVLSLISVAFRQDLLVSIPSEVVRTLRDLAIGRAHARRLLRPALIDAFQAPLGASFGRANWAAADEDEDWIRVDGAQDAHSDPTCPFGKRIDIVNGTGSAFD
jgi:hypothetical protein